MGIMQSLRRRDKRGSVREAAPPPKTETPPLMMLMPDAGGIATYQLHQFSSARSAEFYLDSTLRGQISQGAVFFWALTWQPADGLGIAEPLVVIRDLNKLVVYPFSFSELASAENFLRSEMKRGLDLTQVMLYWAAPARIDIDFWGRSTVTPAVAPRRDVLAPARPAPETIADPEAGREALEPEPALVQATIIPLPQQRPDRRYLTEADVAEAVRAMNAGTATQAPEAASSPGAAVIDFPSASQRLAQSKSNRAAITVWANIANALDDALDVYVARQVRAKLSWNRLMRALGAAVDIQRRIAAETVWANASQALSAAASVAVAHRSTMGGAWSNAATALSAAAQLSERRRVMRRAWLNIAWTLEEAAYAHALESRARVSRAWRLAAIALTEAAGARRHRETAVRLAWGNAWLQVARGAQAQVRAEGLRIAVRNMALAFEEAIETRAYRDEMAAIAAWRAAASAIEEALEAKSRLDAATAAWANIGITLHQAAVTRARHEVFVWAWANAAAFMGEYAMAIHARLAAVNAWTNVSDALDEMTGAYMHRRAIASSWENAGCALEEAVAAFEQHERIITGWSNATVAFKEAIVAEAKLRIAQAGLDKKLIADVERAVKSKTIRRKKSTKPAVAEAAPTPVFVADVKLPTEILPASESPFIQNGAETQPQAETTASEAFAETEPAEDPEDALPSLWRTHDASRWEPRTEEPFRGFQSPPGRFYRSERPKRRDI